MMILHGGSDPLVPHNQGEQLYMALNKACLDAVFISLPKAGHGPWNGFLTNDAIREAATMRSTSAAGCAVTNPSPVHADVEDGHRLPRSTPEEVGRRQWASNGGLIMRPVAFAIIVVLLAMPPTEGQERFSFFQASTPESVARMLQLAGLRDDDVVIDLGSGDGLIPLTAARMNARLRGRGVDIDPKLVKESNERAAREGVADRVSFTHQNAFDADLREATVVTMWLFPELMRLLRPVILERARPGTRVLTSTWALGNWQPDQVNNDGTPIYLWIVPARVAGNWAWDLPLPGRRMQEACVLDQHFQTVEGVVRAGDRREVLEAVSLRGADIAFTLNITLEGLGLTRHEFSGTVSANEINGSVKVTPLNQAALTLPWRARRTDRSDYFAPTGTAMFRQPVPVR